MERCLFEQYLTLMLLQCNNIGDIYEYHDPCHSPMKVVPQRMSTEVAQNQQCCGNSGPLAVTRSDVSTQVRGRKSAATLRVDDAGAKSNNGGIEQVAVGLDSVP